MNIELIVASTAITLALFFYSIGVFWERHNERLRLPHVIMFWAGLVCDTTGTTVMTAIAHTEGSSALSMHAVTGVIAIVLMLFHAGWATYTLIKNDNKKMKTFHTFSIVVWLVWLVPYIIGMLIGIPMIALPAVCASSIAVVVVVLIGYIICRRTRAKKGLL